MTQELGNRAQLVEASSLPPMGKAVPDAPGSCRCQGLAEDMPLLTCWISCITSCMEERRRGRARSLPFSLPKLGFVLLLSKLCCFGQFLVLLNHMLLRAATAPGVLVEDLEGEGCSSGGVSPLAAVSVSVGDSRSS